MEPLLLGHAFIGQLFYTPFNEYAYNEVNVLNYWEYWTASFACVFLAFDRFKNI